MIRPVVKCSDGFSISIQASEYHYCQPRNNIGPYNKVEIGFPSEPESLLLPYIEALGENPDPCKSVYAYVPSNIVIEILAKHNGIEHESIYNCPPLD
jgi:hypothetical protein